MGRYGLDHSGVGLWRGATTSTRTTPPPSAPTCVHEANAIGAGRPPPQFPSTRQRGFAARIHMHPAKRRFLQFLVLGSLFGAAIVLSTVSLVATPLREWDANPARARATLYDAQLRMDRLRLETRSFGQRAKILLQQVQRTHAAAARRTGLVEKAAAQSYREVARDQLHEYHMTMKEVILFQMSHRRRLDAVRRDLDLPIGGTGSNLSEASSNHLQPSIIFESIEAIKAAMNTSSPRVEISSDQELEHAVLPEPQQRLVVDDEPTPSISGLVQLLLWTTAIATVSVMATFAVSADILKHTTKLILVHKTLVNLLSTVIIIERIEDEEENLAFDDSSSSVRKRR